MKDEEIITFKLLPLSPFPPNCCQLHNIISSLTLRTLTETFVVVFFIVEQKFKQVES